MIGIKFIAINKEIRKDIEKLTFLKFCLDRGINPLAWRCVSSQCLLQPFLVEKLKNWNNF